MVKNFFLTDSGIDQIKFSDGTSYTNKEIWNEAKVTVRVDDALWNSNDATSTRTVLDTTDTQAGFFAQQTTTYNGNNVFVAYFSDDGTMWTNSFDPLARHDWQKWETSYKADGSISAEAVTFDVKDASGNPVKIYRGVGGMVAGSAGDDVLRSAVAGSTLIGDRGNDQLTGAAGSDLLYGGTGDDRYTVGAGDRVFEFADQGFDVVEATASHTLGAGQSIEELRLAASTGNADLDLTGNELDNLLVGNDGANILDGGNGGTDKIDGGEGSDTVSYASSGRKVTIALNDAVTWDGVSNDTLISIENAIGSAFNDSLVGDANANVLDGGDGGADTINGGGGIDTVSYASSSRKVVVDMYNRATWDGVTNDTLISIENAIGSAFDDTLLGDAGDNVLDGGKGGADTINGGAGNDTVSYASSSRKVVIDMYNRATWDGVTNDTLTLIENAIGSAFDDTLLGDAGDNILDGGEGGADKIDGGAGIDTVSYASSGRKVTIALNDAVTWDGVTNDTLTSIENAIGSAFNDTLVGDANANILDGGAGNDTMKGGLGNDIYVVDAVGDVITENAGEGTDGVRTTLTSYTLGAELENLRYTGAAAFTGTGNALANTITGAAADDILIGGAGNDALNGAAGDDNLNGGAGNDVLRGGDGDDVYRVDNSGDQVFESAGQGFDTVVSDNSFTLAAGQEIEVLRLTATTVARGLAGNEFDNTLIGNAGDNGLAGNDGNDVIDGGDGGADKIDGGAGNDTVSYASSSRRVTIALNDAITWDGVTNDTLTSIENAIGSAFNDSLVGDANANVLDGGDGGADKIDGGAGNDTVSYASSSRKVTIALNDAVTWDGVSNDTLTSIENAIGSAFNDTLVGDANANVLDGGDGGADKIDGGAGNDTVSYASSSRKVTIALNDAVTWDGVSNDTLTSIENAIGSAFNDSLVGDANANILDGGAGTDAMRGGLGNDTYVVDVAGDTVTEAANEGTDTLIAGNTHYTLAAGVSVELMRFADAVTGNFNLEGNEFANTLSGNAGANRLIGGGGSDTLSGKGGADAFVFNATLGSGNLDRILDFVSGEDKILLDNSVMAVLQDGALAASAFKNLSQAAADADDRILYNQATGDLWYDADGSGSAAGVRIAVLDNKAALTYQDIVVI